MVKCLTNPLSAYISQIPGPPTVYLRTDRPRLIQSPPFIQSTGNEPFFLVKFVCLSVSLLGSLGRLVASSKSPSPTENIPTAPKLAFSKSHSFACLCYVFLFGPWGLTPAGGQVLNTSCFARRIRPCLKRLVDRPGLAWTTLIEESAEAGCRGCWWVPLSDSTEGRVAQRGRETVAVASSRVIGGGRGKRCASGQGSGRGSSHVRNIVA